MSASSLNKSLSIVQFLCVTRAWAGAQGEEGTDSEGASYLLVQAHYASTVVTDLSERHLQQPLHKDLQRGLDDEHREGFALMATEGVGFWSLNKKTKNFNQ